MEKKMEATIGYWGHNRGGLEIWTLRLEALELASTTKKNQPQHLGFRVWGRV